MIDIKNVSKSFKNQKVLQNITMQLPDKGLVFILGQSGCGKTTLLNCIAGLIDFDGTIQINGDNVSIFSNDDLAAYRLKNIGFVFQDFKLFNHDTVYDNIAFPMENISMLDQKYQKRKVIDVLDIVCMSNFIDEKVANLSGGEKQRIAIARALINDPKVLLCDEPTGALDTSTKTLIMTILKTISTSKLVLVVSHDEELAKLYADKTYIIKDGKVLRRVGTSKIKTKDYLPIYQDLDKSKKPRIPFHFLLNHTKNAIKQRKFRTLITNLIVSFGLLGSGLAFMLSDTIYQSVVGTYTNIVADNQVIVNLAKSRQATNEIISPNFNEILRLYNRYNDYFNGIGVCYLTDFENFFKDKNELTLSSSVYQYKISGYSARNINEFKWLKDCKSPIYPNEIEELREDEIIISITPQILREICYQFHIEKTVERLAKFLLENKVLVTFNFANDNWQYHDEQILRFKGFTLEAEPTIYHSFNLWNEYMFETMMRMPSNLNVSEKEKLPWIMKKVNYLMLKDEPEYFISKARINDDLTKFVFEVADRLYYPRLFKDTLCKNLRRLLVFQNNFDSLPTSEWKYMKSLQKSIKNPIFSTNSGYSVYGSNVLSGFNNVMFFANSKKILQETTDAFASNGYDPTASINMPKGVLQGHYTKTSNNGVFFKGIEEEIIDGRPPTNLNEIVISTGMARSLFDILNPIGKTLNLCITSDNIDSTINKHNLTFNNDELTIVGTIKNDSNILYQNEYWTVNYFQCRLGVSIFQLLPYGMSFEIDDKETTENVISNLEKNYPNYEFLNPMQDIEEQANILCNHMRAILFSLSIVTLLIAVCLIAMCNNLHVMEIKKDIGLIRCIGINEKESKKMLYFHSLFIAIMGAFTCMIELIIFYFAIQLGIGDMFGISLKNTFSIMPYLIVMILSIVIGLIPAILTSFKMKNIDPLEAIKQ